MTRTQLIAIWAFATLVAGCPRVEVDRCTGANPHPECPNATPGDAGGDAADDAALADVGDDLGDTSRPCGGACAAPTPVCDEGTDTCVACLQTSDCPTGVCSAEHTCVECLQTSDCAAGVCDTATSTCVECLADTDCPDADAARCDPGTHTCTPCADSSSCAHLTATTACDAGECVECTGTEYGACDGVCDSRLRTCTTIPPAMSGLCEPCVSDAQCRTGMLCAPMTFDAADGTGPAEVGTYCLWRRDANVSDAPNGSCFAVPPYVRATELTSLDGTTDTVCELRTSTCAALTAFDTACPAPGMNDACGAPGFDDGLCVALDAVTNRCTVVCGGDDDCKQGFACDTSVTPNRCEL